jgi:hypothetical protein
MVKSVRPCYISNLSSGVELFRTIHALFLRHRIIYPLALYDLTRTFERHRLVLHRPMTITELSQCLKIMVPSARGNSSYCQHPFMFVSWVMPYGVVCQSRNSCRVYAISFLTGTFLPTLSKVRRSICTDHDTSQACLFEHASRRGN